MATSRTRQILRFRDCQNRRRQWIGFWDIADWIASKRGSTDSRDEGLRQQGYSDLLTAVLASQFKRGNKSLVLHVLPQTPLGPGCLRLTTDRLRAWIDLHGTGMVSEQILPRCWVPRSLVQRWFERRRMVWPDVFDPVESGEVRAAVSRPRRRGPKPGTLDRYGAADRALFNEIKRIMRVDRVSVSAAATRLADAGKIAGVGTSVSRAKRLAERYRRQSKN
jgi:hypothetical protein